MAQQPGPLPPPSTPWVDQPRTPSLSFRQYFLTLDQAARGIMGFFAAATFAMPANPPTPATPPTLINAANDAAAQAAGVPIGGFYRTGNAVQIRLV